MDKIKEKWLLFFIIGLLFLIIGELRKRE